MKIARFHVADGPARPGRVDGDHVTDLSDVAGVASCTLGRSFDIRGPIGPWLTTADEIADPLGNHVVAEP